MLHLLCLKSLAPRPNLPLPLVHLVTPELAKLLIISTSLCPTLKDSLLFLPLLVSTSLYPTLKDSLLFFLDCLWRLCNTTQSYIPHMGIEPLPVNKAPAAKDFTSKMEGTLESIRKNLEKAKEQMKLNANKHCSAVPDYTIGQQVWLATKNLQLTCTSWKLTERWLGPYTIIGLTGPNAIKLKLLRSLQIHPIVNISWVKPYLGPMEGQTPYQPGLVHMTEDRDNEWEVDHIVDSHLKIKNSNTSFIGEAMMTQIIHGSPNLISETQKMSSVISTNLTPPLHALFPLIWQISFCSSKSSQSHSLK